MSNHTHVYLLFVFVRRLLGCLSFFFFCYFLLFHIMILLLIALIRKSGVCVPIQPASVQAQFRVDSKPPPIPRKLLWAFEVARSPVVHVRLHWRAPRLCVVPALPMYRRAAKHSKYIKSVIDTHTHACTQINAHAHSHPGAYLFAQHGRLHVFLLQQLSQHRHVLQRVLQRALTHQPLFFCKNKSIKNTWQPLLPLLFLAKWSKRE